MSELVSIQTVTDVDAGGEHYQTSAEIVIANLPRPAPQDTALVKMLTPEGITLTAHINPIQALDLIRGLSQFVGRQVEGS